MAIRSNNTQGNQFHDEATGQFTSSDAGSVAKTETAISYAPTKTRKGAKRIYFSDLSKDIQDRMERDYILKHAEILSANDYFYDNFNTSKDNSESRKVLRQKMLVDEFNEQSKNGPKKKDKQAVLLLGLPGSGKSTIATPLMKEMGAFVVDADNFKNRIPEFQKDKRMVSAVHHESVNLSNDFRNELSDSGYNMIIGKVGGDYESVDYILDELANKGYDIKVVLNDLPFEEALDRTIGRYDRGETDRLIPFWTLKNADKNVFDTFDKVLQHKAISGGKIYSNDVEKGQSPVLLHEFNK